jgi:HlyD family secretion protein
MRRLAWTALAVLVLAVAAIAGWLIGKPAPPAPGVIEASGRIEGDQSAVGAKVAGKIVRMSVRESDRVERGQVIAQLASEQAAAQLTNAEHLLHSAREQVGEAQARSAAAERQLEAARVTVTVATRESRAQIAEAEAGVGTAQARLRQAEADLEKGAKDYGRARELFARELIAAQQLDQAKAAHEVADGAVEAARKQLVQAEEHLELARASQLAVGVRSKDVETAVERLREARAAVETARARIQSADAGRALAQANLSDTRVVAPFTGTILKKLVEVGEVVAPGTPLVTLVDLSRLYAKVYVSETDMGRVKLRDAARVYTDAFPRRAFEGTVSEISQQAEFTPRDVHTREERTNLVFAVKLSLKNPEGVLKPGMPADAWIRWDPRAPWPAQRE